MSSDLLITICTYNEAQNIEQLIREIRRFESEADILVVDDDSPDGTADVVRRMAESDDGVRLLLRTTNKGLGAATVDAFQYAIDNDYRLLLNLDADFSHHPAHIPELLALMDDCDVAIGSRYVAGGSISGWSWTRHVMSRCVNTYVHLWLGLKTRDSSGSFRCYHVSRLAAVDWSKTISFGYGFQEETLYRCQRIGCRFRETPIAFEDRRHGQTNLNVREIVKAVWDIFKLGIHRFRRIPVGHEDARRKS